jgi:hypothetical protein
MKITDFINRPDADSICVSVEVEVGESDEGKPAFTCDDIGTVAEANETYMVGDEIELTRPEKNMFSDYAADRLRSDREKEFCWEENDL